MRAFILAAVLAAAGLAVPVRASDLVTCVQTQLNALGYDVGDADGRPGPATRAALSQYQKAEGVLTALPLDRFTAVVHCRQLGLRHPEVRALWPSAAVPFTVAADDSVLSEYRAGVRSGLTQALIQLDRSLGISLAAPLTVYVGQDADQILRLARGTLPDNITAARLSRALKTICGERLPRGVSMPGVIAICNAPRQGPRAGTAFAEAATLARHELFHEVQYQLAGDRPPLGDAAWLAVYGPKWLIEGSAMVFEAGPLPLGRTGGLPLAALERHSDGVDAGLMLYALGHAGASVLVHRGGGLSSLVDYYDRLGQGLDWPEAFAQSFGLSPAEFYDGG